MDISGVDLLVSQARGAVTGGRSLRVLISGHDEWLHTSSIEIMNDGDDIPDRLVSFTLPDGSTVMLPASNLLATRIDAKG